MNFLSLAFGGLTWYYKLAAAAVVAAALAAVFGWFVHTQRDVGREEVRAEIRRQAAIDTETNTKESFRRIARQKENQDANVAEVARARADADGAAAARERLQVRLDRFLAAARRAPADTAAGGQRAPADDPIGVLADVLRRADERAGILAGYADAAAAAGRQCVRDYDALSKP